ncbi:hypothetical protein JY651_22850 [Pyxidicoccus parkwayensis]|uniref:Uncharacterized protein n=1 Tax=Pyxidicoccus parkwayensis TaxID=2813578 RepID=A0ABX7PAW2_9BACT|nr:hypothetical protein [Pyxidicoccus parkwaysis]QSQ27576.1 hypothetical protein JY651_22850 [Pyxidicoccus parkwaysis]
MKFKIHLEAVLPPDFPFEKSKQAFESQGWKWVQSITKEQSYFREEIWEAGEDRGAVRYIDDDFLRVIIIRAESNIGGMVATLLQQLESQLPLGYITPLVRLSKSEDPGTRAFAIRGMAAITEEFYGDVFRALKEAALDPEPQFRGLALRCITRYPWFQFIKVLQEAASKETMPELHAEQLALSEDIRKHGRRGT